MSYEEAKIVVDKLFKGEQQPVKLVNEALDIISEKDYAEIQLKWIFIKCPKEKPNR